MRLKTFPVLWGKTLCWVSALSTATQVAGLVPTFRRWSPEWMGLAVLLLPVILPGAAFCIARPNNERVFGEDSWLAQGHRLATPATLWFWLCHFL